MHPVQREMLRLEALFGHEPPPGRAGPPIDECIKDLTDFDGDIAELDRVLFAEVDRCLRLVDGHYSEWAERSARNTAAIGFLQGVTFARAVRNLNAQRQGQISDAMKQRRDFLENT